MTKHLTAVAIVLCWASTTYRAEAAEPAEINLFSASSAISAWGVVAGVANEGAALIDAVKRADQAAVRALLQPSSGTVDVNGREADGTTALHWAAYRNDPNIAQMLVRAGADVKASNRYGVQPLYLACVNGNAAMIALLVRAGADANAVSSNGETALMTAARSGSIDSVKVLVEAGANVNAKETWRGQTALMWAAAEGYADVARLLIDRGADVHARSNAGFTALLFAAREGRIPATRTLLDAGARLDDALPVERRPNAASAAPPPTSAAAPESGLNAFLLAVSNAHYELAAMLLDRGADPNAAPKGWTALHALTWVRKAGIAGSNDPAPPGSGNLDSLEFARRLVAHGANVNARVTKRPPAGITRLNMIGGTPFLLAARTADADYMRLLVQLGADAMLTNEDGTTPLMVAAGIGTAAPGEDPGTEPEVVEAVQFALKLGADVNSVDKNGDTAMHGAASKHVPSVVRLLAAAGAKVDVWNHKDKEGYTPVEIAHGVQRGMSIVASAVTEAAIREAMARR